MPPLATSARRLLALPLALSGALLIALSAGGEGAALARGKSTGESRPSPQAQPQGKDGRERGKGREKAGKKRGKRRGSIPLEGPSHHHPSLPLLKRGIHCPEEMVAVGGRFCIDRFEATLVEVESHELASPFYPPTRGLIAWSVEKYSAVREEAPEGSLARSMPLPEVPEFQKAPFKLKAMSWPGSTPGGYVSGEMAAEACRSSGKRLCKEAEWVTACRGEAQTQFPYGKTYRQDACNVFREDHPAHILHGDSSSNLLDPRLNQIEAEGRPLLRLTGGSPSCASKWGDDAVYDMVGNLDEWVDDPEGTFVGGFYSRATRSGCDARVRTHPVSYFDYSTGVRCCKDPD